MKHVIKEPQGGYTLNGSFTDKEIVELATKVLERQLIGQQLLQPADSKEYFVCKLSAAEREIFAVLYLDNKHRVVGYEELFYGTFDGATIHPREVVKAALEVNAAAVVLAHNHPAGDPEPSLADQKITDRLKEVLALVGIKVLDHIVVGGAYTFSFAENGRL